MNCTMYLSKYYLVPMSKIYPCREFEYGLDKGMNASITQIDTESLK